MKKIKLFPFVFLTFYCSLTLAAPKIEKLSSNEAASVIKQWTDFDAQALCGVAKSTSDYLAKGDDYDAHANHVGMFSTFGIDVTKVAESLEFICKIYQQDAASGSKSRLKDPLFLANHFDFYRWQPDLQQVAKFKAGKNLLKNLPQDKILLTKYYVKQAQGSSQPTSEKPYALYAVPFDERELTLDQADKKKASITRYQFTKQDVLAGVLDTGKLATPLVYLSRTDLEDALMQGTVRVVFDDGPVKVFNVHRNNGHAYDRNIAKEDQKRYWYFKQVPSVKGYGKDASYKIDIQPKVTVAGDLALWGLGKLVLLNAKEQSRLTVLADTGGAFEDNGYQLDYLSGFYSGWADYYQAWKNKPDYFEAYFLIKKP